MPPRDATRASQTLAPRSLDPKTPHPMDRCLLTSRARAAVICALLMLGALPAALGARTLQAANCHGGKGPNEPCRQATTSECNTCMGLTCSKQGFCTAGGSQQQAPAAGGGGGLFAIGGAVGGGAVGGGVVGSGAVGGGAVGGGAVGGAIIGYPAGDPMGTAGGYPAGYPSGNPAGYPSGYPAGYPGSYPGYPSGNPAAGYPGGNPAGYPGSAAAPACHYGNMLYMPCLSTSQCNTCQGLECIQGTCSFPPSVPGPTTNCHPGKGFGELCNMGKMSECNTCLGLQCVRGVCSGAILSMTGRH